MEIIFILLIALALDLALGEPPNAWHPIAWLGKLIYLEMKLAPETGKVRQLAYGVSMVLVTLSLIVLPIYFFLAYLKEINPVIYIAVAGVLLKCSFSLRGLRQAVHTVKRSLAQNNLTAARTSLKALVSRDTANLSKNQVISATVESAAENSSDSFVAPLFYFLIFGVLGAIAYRVVNTFDAMVGYHGKFEYLGKFAARLDDMVNFLPARITGMIIVLAALMCKKDVPVCRQPAVGETFSGPFASLGQIIILPCSYCKANRANSLRAIDFRPISSYPVTKLNKFHGASKGNRRLN